MESNKYYIPEIEELHIGFECEHTTNMTAFKINDTDRIYNEPLTIPDLCNYINWSLEDGLDKFVRVKYLDQEDIESLGWIFDKTSDERQLKFYKDNQFLFYRTKTKELGTFTRDPFKNDYMIKYNIDDKLVRFIIIKNKSEFKKLMKQMKIDDIK